MDQDATPALRVKMHPTADRATFRIPHITHRSTVSFRTLHTAFYLPHSACRNSAFYQHLNSHPAGCKTVNY